jgi:predicted DsbA family dithiol-disulfide isomerase
MPSTLAIDACFDLVCPWCLIGKRHLAMALARLAALRPDVEVRVAWHPVILLPDTPEWGVPFRAFYERRLGGPDAVAARQREVREAGRAAGVEFDFDRIAVFPSTLAAHRVVLHAGAQGGARSAEAMIDAILDAYFTRGANIGDPLVLARLAAGCGLDAAGVFAFLESPESRVTLDEARTWARRRGTSSVPCFVLDGHLVVSGAQPWSVLLEAMQGALERRAAPV